MKRLIDKLHQEQMLTAEEFHRLLANRSEETDQYARELANQVRQEVYGNKIYVRGLIEFTNYCKNDCYYCGIRKSNRNADRYRLTEEEILTCCENGYELGFRTFVLQGGEDPYYTDERMESIFRKINKVWPDCALTLSIGEKSYDSYKRFKEAGADRYLLRHETADAVHYGQLHPETQKLSERMDCLWNLKKLGYQVGAGFMVGSPGQTDDCLAEDLVFLQKLKPQMEGIGPFIPHNATRLAQEPAGSVELPLDLDLQQAVEDTLAAKVEQLNEKDGLDSRGAAAAVIKVGTGEILALASCPTYDLSTYRKDYNELAADPAKLEDPSLIIYNPVLTLGRTHIVTNGDQTDTIYDLMSQGKSFADALRTRTFEPDGPNYTPRISAVVYADGSYQMSILKSADGNGESVQRYFFDYPQPVAGEGHFISTYKHNGSPIPSFEGEPLRFACPRTIGDFAHGLWQNLNPDNKVSLFARVIDLETGESGDMIFNKYDAVCSDLDDPEEPELLPEELEQLKKLDAEEE